MQSRPIPAEKRVIKFNQPARNFLTLAIAAGFLAAMVVVAQAVILSDVVDKVFLKHHSLEDVIPEIAILIGLALFRLFFVWSSDVLSQRSACRLKGSLRQSVTQKIFNLGPSYTQGERTGELTGAMVEGVEVLDEYVTVFLPARFLAGLVPAFVLLVVLIIDPPTTLILIFTGAILLLSLALVGGRTRSITERRYLELSWMSAFFLDILQGLSTLKQFNRSREQVDNIREISQRYGATTMEVLKSAFQTSLLLEWGSTIATAMVAVQISLRLMNGILPFNRALALLILTPEFFMPLRQLAIKYHAGTAGKAAASRIFAILDTPARRAPSVPVVKQIPERMDLVFEHVSFGYQDRKRLALQDLSLNIPQGKTFALVGATGAGKTTIANLLLRFIDPDAGLIRVGGMPLEAIDLSEWRAQVAWVPQSPHLFHGSIGDNIRLARPGASQAEVEAAARSAFADEFIQRLPQGYDTSVGEGGARLSGGQRQRLAIARAFLKDAPLLILDEATSHLDSASEIAIDTALQRLFGGRTVIIIAHRLKLAYAAHQVVVMEAGQLIQTGSPDELLNKNGPYQNLVALYEGGLD